MRYVIKPHNYQEYAASFYDTQCLECSAVIEVGDPMGFILENPLAHQGRRYIPNEDRYGPVCYTCLQKLATPMELTLKKSQRPKPS